MRFSALMALVIFSLNASAMSVDWTGLYRFEWVQVDHPSLAGAPVSGARKAYGLNYLGLSPHIIASDGVEISARFDVLANQDSAYTNSQAGQIWGQSLSTTNPSPTNSNVLSNSRQATALNVRELYLTVSQEYGTLLVGRAPFDFGLGMTWNSGRGPFDHWTTNEDMVAYKFIVGNMFFMPKISRAYSEGPSAANAVQDQAIEFQYESEESGSMIAAIVSNRKSSPDTTTSNDVPTSVGGATPAGGTAAARYDAFSMQTTSFVLSRKWETFKFRMEASFMSGTYGVHSAYAALQSPEDVHNNSYGLAIEMDYAKPESKWSTTLRLGQASGDDPTTADVEGFQFNRNYDVAMLLFNHRLGQKDFLRTSLINDRTMHGLDNSIDDEAISNALYISPKIRYAWNDRWDIENTLTYAQLVVNPTNSLDFKKDLGLEWDIGAVYKPRTNIRWVTELGLLSPGSAFKDGATGLDNQFTFGFTTKAAITF